MKKNISIIITIYLLIAGCTQNEILTYDSGDNIYFTRRIQDSVTFTFVHFPDSLEYHYPLEVKLTGNLLKEDTEYRIVADVELSTAMQGKHYEIPETFIFGKNRSYDTCWVKLKKRPELSAREYTLYVMLQETGPLKVSQPGNARVLIRMSNMAKKPQWWDLDVHHYCLGQFSIRKYGRFIAVTGKTDEELAQMDLSELRSEALKFKAWLEEQEANGNPQYEADGKKMTVNVNG